MSSHITVSIDYVHSRRSCVGVFFVYVSGGTVSESGADCANVLFSIYRVRSAAGAILGLNTLLEREHMDYGNHREEREMSDTENK